MGLSADADVATGAAAAVMSHIESKMQTDTSIRAIAVA